MVPLHTYIGWFNFCADRWQPMFKNGKLSTESSILLFGDEMEHHWIMNISKPKLFSFKKFEFPSDVIQHLLISLSYLSDPF